MVRKNIPESMPLPRRRAIDVNCLTALTFVTLFFDRVLKLLVTWLVWIIWLVNLFVTWLVFVMWLAKLLVTWFVFVMWLAKLLVTWFVFDMWLVASANSLAYMLVLLLICCLVWQCLSASSFVWSLKTIIMVVC